MSIPLSVFDPVSLPAETDPREAIDDARTLAAAADALGDLDRRAGDGDFGTSVRTALSQLDRETEQEQPSTFRQWLSALYRGWVVVGGTSGPLFGVYFRELAKAGEADGTPQVEELVEPGEIDPDDVHLPGVFVHRIVEVGTDIEKRIEKRTVRAAGEES